MNSSQQIKKTFQNRCHTYNTLSIDLLSKKLSGKKKKNLSRRSRKKKKNLSRRRSKKKKKLSRRSSRKKKRNRKKKKNSSRRNRKKKKNSSKPSSRKKKRNRKKKKNSSSRSRKKKKLPLKKSTVTLMTWVYQIKSSNWCLKWRLMKSLWQAWKETSTDTWMISTTNLIVYRRVSRLQLNSCSVEERNCSSTRPQVVVRVEFLLQLSFYCWSQRMERKYQPLSR